MNKKILFIIPVLIIGILYFVFLSNKKIEKFYLDDKYYEQSTLTEIELDAFETMLKNKESFAIFVYQPLCSTSEGLNIILNKFQSEYKISFYKIAFSKIKESPNCKYLKYYPSFIIFKDGKMVDYLDANSDKDKKRYESLDDFKTWFMKYVSLKETYNGNLSNENQNNIKKPNNLLENVKLNNVVRNNNKVNIYFFWGNGCPHCAEEHKFFEKIEKEYGSYYNLYTYEVWYSEYNSRLLSTFAYAMGEEVRGVPYTIIGNESFKGFSSSYEDRFIKAIMSQYENSYDVYFDKIKK